MTITERNEFRHTHLLLWAEREKIEEGYCILMRHPSSIFFPVYDYTLMGIVTRAGSNSTYYALIKLQFDANLSQGYFVQHRQENKVSGR